MNRWIVAVALFILGTTVGIFLYRLDVRSSCRAHARFAPAKGLRAAVEATRPGAAAEIRLATHGFAMIESPAMEHPDADALAVGCIAGYAAALIWGRFAPRKRRELPL